MAKNTTSQQKKIKSAACRVQVNSDRHGAIHSIPLRRFLAFGL
jgi:hypothetical protein